MVRRILLALSVVAATTILAAPSGSAGPATMQCDPGVKVSATESPKTVSVLDIGTSDPLDVVDVVVTINGTHFDITAPETTPAVTYAISDASWCLKVATKTDPATRGTGTSGDSTVYNKKAKSLQSIGYVTVYSVTTLGPCYDSTIELNSDFRLTGVINTAQNTRSYESSDGKCTGSSRLLTITDSEQACTDLGGEFAGDLATTGYTTPGWWLCLGNGLQFP